jgi:hypothetical protein
MKSSCLCAALALTITNSGALPASAAVSALTQPETSVAAPVAPMDVADLYLNVAIHNDLKSARAINDYIRPVVDEAGDSIDLDAVQKRHDFIVDKTAELFTAAFGEETAKQLAHAMVNTIEQSQCHATRSSSTTMLDTMSPEPIATVRYHCLVADIARVKQNVEQAVVAETDQAKATSVLGTAMLDGLHSVKIDRPVDGELKLTGREDPKTGQMIWTGDSSLLEGIVNTLQTETAAD